MSLYLVTGGAGFIGSHLVDRLIGDGHRVRIIDNLSTGKRENINPESEFIEADIRDKAALKVAMAEVDGVFHLAAVASVEESVRDWQGTHAINLSATVSILDQAAKTEGKKPKVVYASSAAVYGDSAEIPLAESATPSPITPYGADKLACEYHARAGALVRDVASVGLRFFNVYGPRQDPKSPYSGVISIFMDRIRQGLPVTLYGDGSQVRDFVYVGDVVDCLCLAMEKAEPRPQVFNVCTGRQTSIAMLADLIGIISRRHINVTRAAPRAGDIRQSLGAPDRAKRALGFTAETTLGEGLFRTMESFGDFEPGLALSA
ncbi:MAG: SDR family NAD(P)-dependent oxidoreductase [Magnetovibrionaceae bacterium]